MAGDPTMTEDRKLLERRARTPAFLTPTVARPPDPVRVRRGLRRAGRRSGRPSRCSARRGRTPDHRVLRAGARRSAACSPKPGYAVITGGGPGMHGGGEPRLPGGRRRLGRVQHRAAARAGDQPVRRPRGRVPLLLRPQDDVREVRRSVRDPARRLRDAGRAVRGADADPDRQDPALPGDAGRERRTGAACSTGSGRVMLVEATRSTPRTWTCCRLTDDPDEVVPRSSRSGGRSADRARQRRSGRRHGTARGPPRPTRTRRQRSGSATSIWPSITRTG